MSKITLKNTFNSIKTEQEWELQLLSIKTSKRQGTRYYARQITLSPERKMAEFVSDICDHYLGEGKGSLNKFSSVSEYDGTADSMTIYKLKTDNELISDEYDSFLDAISSPTIEADPFTFNCAYLIKGEIGDEDNRIPVKMICMQKPITTLKRKYAIIRENGRFEELDKKVLSLKPTIDVIIVDTDIYFFTMSGENLFNMARAYKTVCNDRINEIETANFISGFDKFKAIASKGHNPRRFISFNPERLEALKNSRTRKTIAKQFNLPLDSQGNLDAEAEGAAERIVKVLCNKGMVDPFKKLPVEVSSSRPW